MHLPPGHPPSNKDRATLLRRAPARSSSRIDTLLPSRARSRALFSATAPDRPPNFVVELQEEAVQETLSTAAEPAECERRCRNAAESLCIRKGRHRR